MTNDTTSIPTLDVIHVTLEHLGYLGEEFGASRIGPVLYGVYRQTGSSVVVSWCNGCTVYEMSATTAAAAEAVREELVKSGLTATVAGTRIEVYGQEHIDAEVGKMLAP